MRHYMLTLLLLTFGFLGAPSVGFARAASEPQATELPTKPTPATPKRDAAWFFQGLELQGGMNLPASVGGGLILYFPTGFYIGNAFGVMPANFVKLINKVLVKGGAYDSYTADLIQNALTNSFVYDLFLGWDPGKPGGFSFNVGYQLMALGGRASTLGVISKATGKKLAPELAALVRNTVPVKTRLHNATARLGYKLVVFDHLTFDFYVGVLKTFAASSDIQLRSLAKNQSSQVAQAAAAYDRQINSYMRRLYVRYIVSPLIIVNIGYRFW